MIDEWLSGERQRFHKLRRWAKKPKGPILDRSLKAEFESYRKTLSPQRGRTGNRRRIERLLSQHGVDCVRWICECSQGYVI
jgi:hypothetical protein